MGRKRADKNIFDWFQMSQKSFTDTCMCVYSDVYYSRYVKKYVPALGINWSVTAMQVIGKSLINLFLSLSQVLRGFRLRFEPEWPVLSIVEGQMPVREEDGRENGHVGSTE